MTSFTATIISVAITAVAMTTRLVMIMAFVMLIPLVVMTAMSMMRCYPARLNVGIAMVVIAIGIKKCIQQQQLGRH